MDIPPPEFNVTPVTPPPHHIMSKKVLRWLIFVAAGLFVASVLIFFFGGSSFTENGVNLAITGPNQASVGDEVVYKVDFTNKTQTALNNLQLTFTYPDGAVILQDGQVANNPSHIETAKVDSLNPGQSQEKEFHMFLVGDKGNIKTAKVTLVFDAGSIKSQFEKDAETSTTITDVPISLNLSVPPNAVSGDQVNYVLDYRNQSGDDISGLRAVFTYPDGFAFIRATPTQAAAGTWNIPHLRSGEGSRITVTGALSGKQSSNKSLQVVLQRNINGTYVDYEKAGATTSIASPLLDVSISVNGATGYVSHAGDTLQYTLNYQNSSNDTLNGLILAVRLDGPMYDLSTIDSHGGSFDTGSNTLSWNSSVLPDLDSLKPNQKGSVIFSVKLKPNQGTGSSSFFVHASADLSTQNVPSDLNTDQLDAKDDLVTKITSQPTFTQQTYYADPAFGTLGPIPPTVGQETGYTVHWKLTNPGNTLSSAKLVATLPVGVNWKNVISVGAGQPQPTYNKTSGQLIWNLGTLPAGVGVSADRYELAFQISIKPSANQSGQLVTLLKSPTLSGTDSFTQQAIIVNAGDVTTNDTVDHSGQGTVQ